MKRLRFARLVLALLAVLASVEAQAAAEAGSQGKVHTYMFSDAAGTIPVLTTDLVDGFAATIDVNLHGSTTVNNFSSQTTVVQQVAGVPEPGSLALFGTAVACMSMLLRRHHLRSGRI